MQNNKAEMGNIMDFEVYGVALDPQLSNLHVLTAGVGFAPMEKSTLDLVFHHYRQDKLATLDNERTNLRPRADQQNERALGNGIDLIWGWRPNKQWRVEVAAGVFLPSGRFRQSDKADADKARNVYAGNVEIKYYPNWTF
ncbi:alginate export family protein [Lautropia mirabilis]